MPFSFLREALGGPKPNKEPSCSFCGRSREQVRALVAKDKEIAICADCVALSLAVIDNGQVQNTAPSEFSILALTHQLPGLEDEERVGRLIDAALILNGGDPEGALQIARAATTAEQPRAAVRALRSIEAERRSSGIWTQLLVAHYRLGEYEEAWAASEAIDRSELDAGLRALMAHNEAAVRLRMQEQIEEREVEAMWSELIRARAELQQAYGEAYEDTMAAVLAECELLLGRQAAAEARLMALPKEKRGARGLLLLGDIRAAVDDPIGARGRYTEALEVAKKGHPIREELATRLALGKSPYR